MLKYGRSVYLDVAVSFDLFGTLVDADRPASPATAVGGALEARSVVVPADWDDAYTEPHLDVPEGGELSLVDHVVAALESRGVTTSRETVRVAVLAAFDTPVETRPGAAEAVDAAAADGPVGVLSNCSVPGLVEQALSQSDIDTSVFDAVVTSVGCGWRKPDPCAFEAVAAELGVTPDTLVHVGDDPTADGGVESVGGTALLLDDVALSALPAHAGWGADQ